jgi:hypothetical protein
VHIAHRTVHPTGGKHIRGDFLRHFHC